MVIKTLKDSIWFEIETSICLMELWVKRCLNETPMIVCYLKDWLNVFPDFDATDILKYIWLPRGLVEHYFGLWMAWAHNENVYKHQNGGRVAHYSIGSIRHCCLYCAKINSPPPLTFIRYYFYYFLM